MKKNNLHWFAPSFDNNEKKSLSELIKTNYLNEGSVTRDFEKKISNFTGTKYATATTSGTSAIALSLMALGVKRDDEVLIPNFTFIATANAAKLVGAKVKFIDINYENLNIDVKKIEKSITKKTKALITVDVNGRACEYQKIQKICKKFNLKLICDSAEALGSKYKKKYLGTFGDCGCFSFSAAKTLSTGQGGMIVTNNKRIKDKLFELKDQGRITRGTGGKDEHPGIGFNFKYTDLQATVGIQQFKKLRNRLIRIKKRNSLYRKFLKNTNLCIKEYDEGEILQWFDIIIKNKKLKEQIKKKFESLNIGYREFWNPVNSHNLYKKIKCFGNNSYEISKFGIWLPSNFDLSESDIRTVCDVIKSQI